MLVELDITDSERPPPGAPVRVQIVDATYADAPATVVGEAVTVTTDASAGLLAQVELALPPLQVGADYRVYAHVDVDADGMVSVGDFVTTEAYPVREESPLRVTLSRV